MCMCADGMAVSAERNGPPCGLGHRSNLEHSTILYESPDSSPLVRVAWNKLEPNLVATFAMDSTRLTVLDVRVRATPLAAWTTGGRRENWCFSQCGAVVFTGERAFAVQHLVTSRHQVPAQPLHELNGHAAGINSFAWAPHNKSQLCTAGTPCGGEVRTGRPAGC